MTLKDLLEKLLEIDSKERVQSEFKMTLNINGLTIQAIDKEEEITKACDEEPEHPYFDKKNTTNTTKPTFFNSEKKDDEKNNTTKIIKLKIAPEENIIVFFTSSR